MPEENREKQGLTYNKGSRWPLAALLLVPFMIIFLPLYRAARDSVNWKAVLATVLTFEITMFFAEAFSISRGHWVWNDSKLFGYKIWGVPIEEPLFYYWFPPVFIIILMHAIKKRLEKKPS